MRRKDKSRGITLAMILSRTSKILCILLVLLCITNAEEKPQIAIIGGGISGTTAAYHLRKEFDSEPARIDIYEPVKIGGRIATVDIAGRKYEVGASILHPQNKYMYDFLKSFGLRTQDRAMSKLGLYDGQEYVFKESVWNAITSLRLLWRYGFGLFRLDAEIYNLLSKFSRIYEMQDRGHSFTTVEKLIHAMDPNFVNMTKYSIREKLLEQEFSARFIDELALAAMKANYGQNTSINALVGYISLAGAQPGLWCVYGGNNQVPIHLTEASQSNIIKSWVKQIKRRPDGRYDVVSQNDIDFNNNNININQSTDSLSVHTYDIVVVATPLINDMSHQIQFKGFENEIKNFPGEYQRTVVTIIHGEVNWPVLNLKDDGDLDEIILINADPPFTTLSLLRPVDYTRQMKDIPHVWKIFSPVPLTDQILDKYFVIRRETKVIDWLAYPKYIPPDFLGPFKLAKRLYYTSGIEWAGSAMEMGAIAGRNVAILAHSEWTGIPEWIDSMPKLKDEL